MQKTGLINRKGKTGRNQINRAEWRRIPKPKTQTVCPTAPLPNTSRKLLYSRPNTAPETLPTSACIRPRRGLYLVDLDESMPPQVGAKLGAAAAEGSHGRRASRSRSNRPGWRCCPGPARPAPPLPHTRWFPVKNRGLALGACPCWEGERGASRFDQRLRVSLGHALYPVLCFVKTAVFSRCCCKNKPKQSRAAAEPGGLAVRAGHAALSAVGRRRMRHRLPQTGKMGERRIVRAAVLGLVLGAGACYCYRLWRRAAGRGRRRGAPCVPPSGEEEGEEEEEEGRWRRRGTGSAVLPLPQ